MFLAFHFFLDELLLKCNFYLVRFILASLTLWNIYRNYYLAEILVKVMRLYQAHQCQVNMTIWSCNSVHWIIPKEEKHSSRFICVRSFENKQTGNVCYPNLYHTYIVIHVQR